MKKLLLLLFFLTNHLFFAQTSTKTFETESQGSRYFSDNGVVFEIISHSDLFDIQTNFLDEGQKSTISNNRFIAKDSTLSDPSFSIKTTSNLFKVSSFWIQLSSDLNLSDLGELNITGKLNGTVEFSYTKTTGFTTSSSNNNGYVLIDLTDLDGQDYSNITIDELRITANGNYKNVSLDTLTWTKQPQPIALSELDELEVEKNQINIDCYGANTGQAWVTPKGGKSPYTYYWPHSQSTENTARNLAAGRYSVWVIDANGITIRSEFQIVYTAEKLKIASHWRRDVSCYSSNDGEAGISIYGGTPPYTYSWSPSNHTDFTAINLTEGDHTVTVTDSKGCTLSYTIRVYKQNNGWVPITNTSIVKKYGDAPEVLDAKVPSGLPGGYLNWYIGENKSPTNAAPTIKTDKVGEQIYWVSVATALCPESNLVKIVVNIEPKELSVRPDSLTKVYGEMDPELTYSVTGLVNNDTLSGHLTRDPGESVGLYYIDRGTLGLNVKDNYLFGFTRAPFEITPAVMTGVSLLDSSFAYDAIKKELLVSGELPLGAAVTYSGNGQIDAGEYEVNALVQAPNYLDLLLKAKLTIEKIPMKGVSLLDSSFAYDATKKELLVSGELPLGAAVTYSGNGQIDAGEYEVEALVQAPNYLDLPLKAKLTIEKIPIKGVSLLDSSFAYDATKKELLVSGELPLGAAVTYFGNGQIDAGEYEVEALVQAPNYLDLPLKAKLTIEKIPMKGVSLLDSSFAYDATKKELLVSGELPLGAAVSYSGNGQIDAGEYEVEALVQAPNYLDLPLKAKLTIEKIPMKGVSLLDSSFAYDATKKELLVSGKLPLGAAITYFGNGQIDAGEYEVEALVQAPNYLDLPLKAKLTIEKIPMKGVSLLDSSFAYDATKKELLVSGELPLGAAVSYFGNGQIDAGEYEVEALVQAPNYLDLPLKAKLTIEKIPMKGVSLLDSSFAYDATKKELLVSGELPLGAAVSYSGNGQIDAGEYEVEALVQAPNYLDLPLKAKLTIEKIPMKGVSLLDSSFAYDATKKELLVSGELPLGAAVSYSGNGQIDAGEYEVNALVQAPNYLDLPLKAKLTIEKIPMKGVSLLDSSFAYDATKKELLVSGELPLGAAVSYSGNGQIDAGEYEVEALVQAPNYLDLPLKAKLTIEKIPMKGVSLLDSSFAYDATKKELLVSGELPLGAAVSYSGNGQIDAGEYEVEALVQAPNYLDLPLKAKLTIDKAAQSIDFRELLPVVFNNNIKLQLTAASSSRLPVSYTYSFEGSKAAAIVTSLGKVTVISTGSIVITAHQSGNENYLPAQSISHVLVIENDEALIESYSINKVNKGALLSSSFFRMNCDEISNQVSVELQVSSGALASTTSNFVINTPKPGIYHQEIVVTSQSGSTIKKYELIIERPFNFEDIVIQKFDNTLLVNNNPQTNGGYRFVGYKWFKNGKLIGTEQAYFVGNKKEDLLDRNALYSIELLTDKGEVLHSCSSTIEYSYSHSIRLYPNPIVKNGVLELALDYPDSSLEDAVATVYSITGQFLFKIPIEGSISKIVLPNTISEGVYFVVVKINGKNQPLKFIVKP